jgi:competence protein ComEC
MDPLKIEGVNVQFINPSEPIRKDKAELLSFDETNDNALVMRLTYKNISYLLPSDISSSVEENIIKQKQDIESQILLVPHHGSRRSSYDAFLQRVCPSVAVLSVGKDNLFRLPHPDTIARYHARNIPLFRTDRHGAVTITTDGKEIKIQAFKNGS